MHTTGSVASNTAGTSNQSSTVEPDPHHGLQQSPTKEK